MMTMRTLVAVVAAVAMLSSPSIHVAASPDVALTTTTTTATSTKAADDTEKAFDGSHKSWSFGTVSNRIYDTIDAHLAGDATTVYCGCKYDTATEYVDWKSCGLKARLDVKRQQKVEAEHIVPSAILCGLTKEYRDPNHFCTGSYANSRACAAKVAPCKYAYTDLHNLWAAAGEINGDRSDRPFVDDVKGERRVYGDCDFEVVYDTEDSLGTRVEPPTSAKGLIGRTSLYMYEAYTRRGLQVQMVPDQLKLYCKWNCKYPPSKSECERNTAVKKLQGNSNHVTDKRCQGRQYSEATCNKNCNKDALAAARQQGNPMCSSHTCLQGTKIENHATQVCDTPICQNWQCCKPPARAVCSKHKCNNGTPRSFSSEHECKTPFCVDYECCKDSGQRPTCLLHECGRGYTMKPDSSTFQCKGIDCEESECCNPTTARKPIPRRGAKCPKVAITQVYMDGSYQNHVELTNFGDTDVDLEGKKPIGSTQLYLGQVEGDAWTAADPHPFKRPSYRRPKRILKPGATWVYSKKTSRGRSWLPKYLTERYKNGAKPANGYDIIPFSFGMANSIVLYYDDQDETEGVGQLRVCDVFAVPRGARDSRSGQSWMRKLSLSEMPPTHYYFATDPKSSWTKLSLFTVKIAKPTENTYLGYHKFPGQSAPTPTPTTSPTTSPTPTTPTSVSEPNKNEVLTPFKQRVDCVTECDKTRFRGKDERCVSGCQEVTSGDQKSFKCTPKRTARGADLVASRYGCAMAFGLTKMSSCDKFCGGGSYGNRCKVACKIREKKGHDYSADCIKYICKTSEKFCVLGCAFAEGFADMINYAKAYYDKDGKTKKLR